MQALIKQRCDVTMPIRTGGEYLKRWGYRPQRPLKRAYEPDPVAVDRWLAEAYAVVEQRAKSEGATIHWEDESGLRSDEQGGMGLFTD